MQCSGRVGGCAASSWLRANMLCLAELNEELDHCVVLTVLWTKLSFAWQVRLVCHGEHGDLERQLS